MGVKMEEKTEKTLSALLWGLAKSTVEKVKEYKTAGGLIQTTNMYVKPKFENFSYKEGGTSYTTSYNYVEKEEWHWRDQHDFIQKVIKQFPEYSDCVLEIAKRCEASKGQAEFWLSRFVQILARKAVEPVTESFLVDQVTTFVGDIDKSPRDWKAKVWINGVWVEEKQCQLEDGILLRQVMPSDMEDEKPLDMLPVFQPVFFPEISSAVIELSMRAKESIEVQKEIELILDVFRLFGQGSVHSVKVQISAKSFTNLGLITSPNLPQAAHYRYGFKANDVTQFSALAKSLKSILRTPLDPSQNVSDTLSIAFQRYKDAILQAVTIESRITSAITCLEALYLKSEERMELSHRLGQRVSALLRLFGFIALEVYNNLNQAYDIRSTFIHGSQVDKGRQATAGKLCEHILEYARVSLLVFFQLKDTTDKDKFINKLDNSLLDEKALAKLKELFGKEIIVTGHNS